ncbi:hypothetical protein AX15_000419 [Amanita polypyramis BW_CC]|nr:hypothetical protein AX15_000419 [Amanita polypyramis BW_CC]
MFMSTRPNSISKFYRSTNSVKVSNISPRVNEHEIIALFNTLIGPLMRFLLNLSMIIDDRAGEVCGSQEVKDCGSYALELTFCNRDAAMKALCMTGYAISGTLLKVTPVLVQGEDLKRLQKDDRRNLYVLGLPFSLTKAELFNMFACYGTVTHCVILATLDNSSRRRGFVVMSTHEEARQVMAALTCTQLKGHTLDISWAVVQRSQGFLDGGDRSMALDPRPSSRVNFRRNQSSYVANSSNSSSNSIELDFSSLVLSPTPTSTLLVSNLPTLLFGQLHDLHPLFVPFGPIKDIQVVGGSPVGSTSVIVVYATVVAAKEAKESLTGQCYANFRVETCYIRSASQVSQTQNPNFCGFGTNDLAFSNECAEFSHPLASGLAGAHYNAKVCQYLNSHLESLAKTNATPSIHQSLPALPVNLKLPGCSSSSSRKVYKSPLKGPM